MTIDQLFARSVKNGECLEFGKGTRYGTVKHSGESINAHRFAWTVIHGEIPKGVCVCHKCDNPKCVNPEHLFLGTQKENIRDAMEKGRIKHTPGKGNYKLSLYEAEFIRDAKGKITRRVLAYVFGIKKDTITKIWSGSRWYSLNRLCINTDEVS